MALFRFPWVRQWFRRNTRPIPEPAAIKWRRRLSLAYALIAWNTFGIVFYYAITGKEKTIGKLENDKTETRAEYYIRILNLDKVKVKRYTNFEKVEEYDYDRSKDNHESTKFTGENILDEKNIIGTQQENIY